MKWVSKGRCYRQLKGTTDFSISALAPAQLVWRTMISTLGYFLMELCMPCQRTAGPLEPLFAGQEMVARQTPVPALPAAISDGESGTRGQGPGRRRRWPRPGLVALPRGK